MNGDINKEQNTAVFKPLCTHIKKLTKKQVNQIYQNPVQIKCQTHQLNVNDSSLCLHCNRIFCGENSQQKCIFTHYMLNKDHIFSINLQKGTILCNLCQESIQLICQTHQKIDKNNQEVQKLKRFISFIKDSSSKLKDIHSQNKLQMTKTLNYCGLHNLGNTCFLNSVLQVLFYSKPLSSLYDEIKILNNGFSKGIVSKNKNLNKQLEYFYDDIIEQGENKIWHVVSKKKDKINEHNQKLIKAITSCKFNQLFKTFIKQMQPQENQQTSKYLYQPAQILNYLSHIDSKYSYKQQQDAQEALLFIVDILVQGQLISMTYDLPRYQKVQKLIGRQKISPTQRIFGTYLVSQIYCQQCKKISYTFDLTYHLSINLNSKTDLQAQKKSLKNHLSKEIEMKDKVYYKKLKYPQNQNQELVLADFLFQFFKQQRLTQRQNFYACSNCSSLTGLKKFYLVDLPQILIISFKRFNHKMVKNTKYAKFQEFIDLKDVSLLVLDEDNEIQQVDTKYRLYGVIIHLGDTIHNGHYICYVRTSQNIWLRCSDSQISKVNFKQVKQKQAYVLLYQKYHQEKK